MTEVQARAVRWPFQGKNRPIGVLLDGGEIHSNDLAWAAENSYDRYIAQAAKTLLLNIMLKDQLPSRPGMVKVIEGIDHAGILERLSSLWAGMYLGSTISILAVYFTFNPLGPLQGYRYWKCWCIIVSDSHLYKPVASIPWEPSGWRFHKRTVRP